jgi:putative transposase
VIPYSLNSLYRSIGLTKQAVFDYQKRQTAFDLELSELIVQVDTIREEHPGCGAEKMYDTLKPKLLGRDKFCELFMALGYRVQKYRNYHRTTIPTHIKYPNLIQGMQILKPYQVIQSDITYYNINNKFYYIVFIIDVYTREILSHVTSDNLRAEANIKALKLAIKKMDYTGWECIHHSDRGSQYVSNGYIGLLKTNKIHVSMGLVAQDNAYAERINGTIKNEYLNRWKIEDEKDLVKKVNKAVENYNEKRKHQAFRNRYSPLEFKKTLLDLSTQERPKVIIYAEGNYEIKEASSLLNFNPSKEPQALNCPIGF